jgi:CHAT domain-containing protein
MVLIVSVKRPISDPSRIWWCPTGPLAFLPLHAAGLYPKDDSSKPAPGSCISDFVISSYAQTVTTLINGFKKSGTISSGILLISQPETPGLSPLPGTVPETEAVQQQMNGSKICSLSLTGETASVSRVMQEMESHSCVHLACHAVQDPSSPLKSGFCLHNGRLDLSKIITKQFSNSDLAFLSACQTSSGDAKLSEEAVHLAAGMLAVGYRGVVATMWSIDDSYGQQVAEDFYSKLICLSAHGEEKGLSSACAAHALYFAMQRLRQKIGYSKSNCFVWVPYVHFGV